MAKRKADAYQPETVWYKIKSRTYTQVKGAGNCSRSGDRRTGRIFRLAEGQPGRHLLAAVIARSLMRMSLGGPHQHV